MDLGKYTVIEAARVLNEEAAHVDMVVHGSQHPTVYRPTDSVWPVIHQRRAQTGGYALCGLRALGSLVLTHTLQFLANDPTNYCFDLRRPFGRNRS